MGDNGFGWLSRGGVSGRKRMINSIDALTGEQDCTEAVLMQSRPSWVFIPAAIVAIVAYIIATMIGAGDLPRMALALGCGALLSTLLTSYWILAHRPGEVVLARSSKMSARAIEVAERWPAGIEGRLESAIFSKKVRLGGRDYYLARPFVARFREIVSGD